MMAQILCLYYCSLGIKEDEGGMGSKDISWFIVSGTHAHTFIDDDPIGRHKNSVSL